LSLAPNEGYRFRASENRVSRRICGPKREDEVKGKWRTAKSEERSER
jgi:hypothetical protein